MRRKTDDFSATKLLEVEHKLNLKVFNFRETAILAFFWLPFIPPPTIPVFSLLSQMAQDQFSFPPFTWGP